MSLASSVTRPSARGRLCAALVLSVASLALSCPRLLAEEVFAALNGGLPILPAPIAAGPIAAGPITAGPITAGPTLADPISSAVSMRSERGELYLLCQSDATLIAMKSTDDGASLSPYPLTFGQHDLSSFRQLSLLGRVVKHPVALFIADEGGNPGIYGLSIASDGELALYGGYRLDDLSDGPVTSYRALPQGPDRFGIAYLKSGALKCSLVSSSLGGLRISNLALSDGTAAVSDYGIFERFVAGHTSLVGYFTASDPQGTRSLHAFSMVDDALTECVVLDTAVDRGSQQVRFYLTSDHRPRIVWASGQQVVSYQQTTDGSWLKEGVASLPGPDFRVFPISDGTTFRVAAVTYPTASLYGDILAPAAFPNPPVSGPVLGEWGGLASARRGLFLLTFLTESEGRKQVQSLLCDLAQSAWTPRQFPVPSGCQILDAWFSGTLTATFAALLARDAEGEHLLVYRISRISPDYEGMLDVPMSTPGPLQGQLLGNEVLVLSTPETLLAFDTRSWETQSFDPGSSLSAVPSALSADQPRLYLLQTAQGSFLLRRKM